MKKLSIIIPVYNEAPFLRRCLDSVSNAPNEVEIIVIDDASTDGSVEICREYEKKYDPRFRFVYFMLNRGVSYARNYGLSMAEGKYVTFLDSDDEMRIGGIPAMLYHVDKTDRPVIQFNHSRYYQRIGKIVTKRMDVNIPTASTSTLSPASQSTKSGVMIGARRLLTMVMLTE